MGDSNVLDNSQPENYCYRVIGTNGTSCTCKCSCGAAKRDNIDAYLASFPTGYRFTPTDEELVRDYLARKVSNQPLEPNKIKSVNLYKHNPDDLLEKFKEYGEERNEWYFFTPRERKYRRGSRPKRDAGCGYWKATGVDKAINISQNGKKIGSKKTLVYYRGKPPKGTKTNFIMHEFVLDEKLQNNSETNKQNTNHDQMRLNEWVLCRIHKKDGKSSKKKDDDKSSKKKDEIRTQNESDYEAEAPTAETDHDDEYDQELLPETEANGSNSTLEPTNIEANINEEESSLRWRSINDRGSALPNNFDHSNYTLMDDHHDDGSLAPSQVVPDHEYPPHAPQSDNNQAFFDPFPDMGDPNLAYKEQIRIAYGLLYMEVENGSNLYHQQAPFSDSNRMEFYDFHGQNNFDSSQVDVKCTPDFMLVDNNFHTNSSTMNVIYQPQPAPNFQMYSTHGRDLRHDHSGHLR